MKIQMFRTSDKRRAPPLKCEIAANSVGQTGTPTLTLFTEDKLFVVIEPENEREARELLAAAHVACHNIGGK